VRRVSIIRKKVNSRAIKKIIPIYFIFSILFFNFIVVSASIEISSVSVDSLNQLNDELMLPVDNIPDSSDTTDNDLNEASQDNLETENADQQISTTDINTNIDKNDITSSDYNPSSTDIFQKSVDDMYVLENQTFNSSYNLDVQENDTQFLIKEPIQYSSINERIVSSEEIVSITENKIGDISTQQLKKVTTGEATDIKSIEFTPSKNLENVKVKIINLKDKPEVISKPEKKNISIYRYLDIKITSNEEYVMESEINSLIFNFKVEYRWLEENKIYKYSIKLLRYHDGEWQNLSTELIQENKTYLFYAAESLGCSTFAIVGSKIVEKQESSRFEGAGIPWSIIFIVILLLSIVLVIVLIKARYIYVEDQNTDE
jgi:PGF-pre-PGF domain-containing protein